ncbi:MAG: hypothetical protein QM831_08995 [Kofleriaceae bacterium]
MPTLRLSLGFMTSTARVGEEDADELGHRMAVLGVHDGVLYVAEDLGDGDEPIVYRMYLDGPRKGHLVPAHGEVPTRFEPCGKTTTEAWMLSTRIVQRRALRLEGQDAPIRKFALQIRVEPVSGLGANGATTVTAFLRPDARLVEVLLLPNNRGMVARVAFTGVPSGLGLPKETVVLLSE